jgi:hypothetical protein
MKRRHALMVGFGLGALAVIGLITFGSGAALLTPSKTSGSSALSSPSAQPSPTLTPSPTGPGPRGGGALVYDPENRGVILFGGTHTVPHADGTNEAVTDGDTWLWDGKAWRRLEVFGPPARSVAMVAYDSARHVVVMFGGGGPTGRGAALLLDDTWTWDGAKWSEMHPAHVPDGRIRAGMAFDSRRGVTVMFGGEGATGGFVDTWTWDGADWTLASPTASPSMRHFVSMAYDPLHENTVLFGGSMPGVRLNDTWTWDGITWTEQAGNAPTASGWSYMTYDFAAKRIVAFVYFGLDNRQPAGYTITWDGRRWTDRTDASQPSPRADVGIAYDEATDQVVVYGGSFDQPQPYSDTWVWDGSKWTLWSPTAGA